MTSSLSLFSPLVQAWFTEQLGEPTEVQERAWPGIAGGRHVIATAPTGSGKTLAAFLWALDRLLCGDWPCGELQVIYISPLKALNNDIQRNLLSPLEELRNRMCAAGMEPPDVRVAVRSGDTDQSERARMLRRPPEILITTPESLNLLVNSKRARAVFGSVRTLILDEVHSVAATKRGAHLITAVDRLVLLSGEFQRLALSATINPLNAVAEWAAGRRLETQNRQTVFVPREIEIVECSSIKKLDLRVRYPAVEDKTPGDQNAWLPYAKTIRAAVRKNQSTLIFVNARQLCEKLSLLLNLDEPGPIAYAHHGSLSREMRSVVERRLKNGELPAIVATSSLEMGIDIGALDEIVMVQTPPSIASALQRVGRTGRRVSETSRGLLLPSHGMDLLASAVISRCMLDRDIEPIQPVQRPLDILAQVVVAMTGVEEWDVDHLFDALRTSAPFFELGRNEFDLTLAMLEGRYGGGRLRHVAPMISVDRVANRVQARKGAMRRVFMEGGSIADRGYFTLRHQDALTKIGELDEEFVWERRLGDAFMLGTQLWKIERITHNDVFVSPTKSPVRMTPFWRAEENSRDYHFARRIGRFLEAADRDLDHPAFRARLLRDHCLDEDAADALIDFLQRQKMATRVGLPHARQVVIEYTALPGADGGMQQVVIHAQWGGRVNRPLAMLLGALWEAEHARRAEAFANNDAIAIAVPGESSFAGLLRSLRADQLEPLLRARLESSGLFGAQFRENAARALMLPKGPPNRRTPLWMHRLRSKELMDAIARFDDFPILLETWRSCLNDEFDLETLRQKLDAIHAGEIVITETHTETPSPFAQGMLWKQTNSYMYRDDEEKGQSPSNLDSDLIKQIALNEKLRPAIDPAFIRALEERLQRCAPGYAPSSEQDFLDWMKERMLLSKPEWDALLAAIQRDHEIDAAVWLDALGEKIVCIIHQNKNVLYAALEYVPEIVSSLKWPPEAIVLQSADSRETTLIAEDVMRRFPAPTDEEQAIEWLGAWLAFYGPLSRSSLPPLLSVAPKHLEALLPVLIDDERLIEGRMTAGAVADEICDAENLERLLRLQRRDAAPQLEARPAKALPLFLAMQQGLYPPGESSGALPRALQPLLAYPAAAPLWEKEFLPARIQRYQPAWLDEVMRESELLWTGCGEKQIAFCFPEQVELLQPAEQTAQEQSLFPNPHAKYDFFRLQELTGLPSHELTHALWQAVWRGEASNNTFAAMRKGIASQFKAGPLEADRRTGRRSGFSRWKSSRPFTGDWFAVEPPAPPEDAMDDLDRRKERVRILLERYGILFRELLLRESPPFRWSELFRALRVMELSGEIVGGYFFEGVQGLQFMNAASIHAFQQSQPDDAVYWMSAVDPASLCGVNVEGVKEHLPERRLSNHLVFHGLDVVLLSRRQGGHLTIHVDATNEDLPRYLQIFHDWLERAASPARSVAIETINQAPAAESPYLSVFKQEFDAVADLGKILLRKRYF